MGCTSVTGITKICLTLFIQKGFLLFTRLNHSIGLRVKVFQSLLGNTPGVTLVPVMPRKAIESFLSPPPCHCSPSASRRTPWLPCEQPSTPSAGRPSSNPWQGRLLWVHVHQFTYCRTLNTLCLIICQHYWWGLIFHHHKQEVHWTSFHSNYHLQ